jgi:hypothetical protein
MLNLHQVTRRLATSLFSDVHGSVDFSRRIGVHRSARHVNLPVSVSTVAMSRFRSASIVRRRRRVLWWRWRTTKSVGRTGVLTCRPLPPVTCATDYNAAHTDQDCNPWHSCDPYCRCKRETCENQHPAQWPPYRKHSTRQGWIVSEALHTVQ